MQIYIFQNQRFGLSSEFSLSSHCTAKEAFKYLSQILTSEYWVSSSSDELERLSALWCPGFVLKLTFE